MNERRATKFREVAQKSQLSITVILENVFDSHNIGAILRSCDSIGIRKIYVVNTSLEKGQDHLILGKRTSMGTRKWVDVEFYKNLDICITEVKKHHSTIVGAALTDTAINYFETDYTQSIAVMFGNEHSGLSEEAMKHCDSLILIPQVGMAESLNVSAAAAIILYEAYRQRHVVGKYADNPDLSSVQSSELLEYLIEKTKIQTRNIKRYKMNPLG